MNYKRTIYICYCLIVIVFAYICGISYAYFFVSVDGESNDINISTLSEEISIKYNDTSNVSMVNAYTGDKITKTFTVSNLSSIDLYYNLLFKNVVNNFENKNDLVYRLYSSNGAYVNYNIMPNSDEYLASNVLISAKDTHEYTLEIEFLKTNEDQSNNMNKTFSANLDITSNVVAGDKIYKDGTLGKVIQDSSLGNESIFMKNDIDGVYFNNSSINGNTIYFYRGSNNLKNNVVLGNICFKIIRTTYDNNIKLIYNGTYENGCSSNITYINNSQFNSDKYYNTYVGYMTGKVNSVMYEDEHNNSNSSIIKTLLDNWYSINISEFNNIISNSSIYCNDRTTHRFTYKGISYNLSGYSNENTGYLFGEINVLKNVTFDCNNINDRFSVNSEIGNNKLINSIGLIDANELYYAGYTNNKNNYLSTPYSYWTMSSAYFNGSGAYNIIAVNGELKGDLVTNKNFVRPVITIDKDTIISSGEGSESSPYILNY